MGYEVLWPSHGEVASEKTEKSWGCLECSPVCTGAGLERVAERTDVARLVRSKGDFSGDPQVELAEAGLCSGWAGTQS